jgi:hypothetical protein
LDSYIAAHLTRLCQQHLVVQEGFSDRDTKNQLQNKLNCFSTNEVQRKDVNIFKVMESKEESQGR